MAFALTHSILRVLILMREIMQQLKATAITMLGALLLVIGLLFVILPGPAILFIPLGLVLLSFQYPKAKHWLRKYQRYSSRAAVKMDRFIKRIKT